MKNIFKFGVFGRIHYFCSMKREEKDTIVEIEDADRGFWYRAWRLYADGFRNMTIGRWLWAIILLKLFIFFVILKLFFFPNLLQQNYDNDEERAQAVRERLI